MIVLISTELIQLYLGDVAINSFKSMYKFSLCLSVYWFATVILHTMSNNLGKWENKRNPRMVQIMFLWQYCRQVPT